MPNEHVKQKIETMFPAAADVPAAADFSPNGGLYEGGLLYLVDGQVKRWSGASETVLSPVCVTKNGETARRPMGPAAMLSTEAALDAMRAAVKAYDRGRGAWPRMKICDRLRCLKTFADKMAAAREESVRLLMWEICKTRPDAEKEFDRTVAYVLDTIEAVKELDRANSRFQEEAGILAQIRRAPLGVVLCMGPFNYPLNETFTTLIPALIMGNTVIAKFPRFGMLCQAPLLHAFAEAFPPGVVNVINGDGRATVGPMIESGEVHALAFIGTSRVANILKKQHPMPNRLRCILGLEAKNPAIVLNDADLDLTVNECLTGSLSFNGQRCTALKLLFVQRKAAEAFVERFAAAVDALPFGMPWEKGVKLTPLPEIDKAKTLQGFVDDALAKGAKIRNAHGALTNRTFYFPPVVYAVQAGMRLYTEEQFGPVAPVAVFDRVDEIVEFISASNYGQQASVFGRDPGVVGPLVDVLANQVCRVNLNAQCQRGPDIYPFAGRKDSAEGTLSVSDALRCFSIRTMAATPDNAANKAVVRAILDARSSNFLNTDYLF
ncbi:MAG: NADP-dependent glyceraldehyde-3-phosphate dehydrogenase [Planctomycetota bacterium]|nr:NADP-dependent glyceraldehyde-3-phosphate dehydrogenase [Planctomycetota bacterium]